MVTTPNEFTLELYRQAWQQARHNELLRAGYVALYTLVVATVVGLLGQDKFRYPVGPYCFLGFLSLLGVLLSGRFAANANRWTRLQKAIQQAHASDLPPGIDPNDVAPSQTGWERVSDRFRVALMIPVAFGFAFIIFALFANWTAWWR